MPSSVVKVMEIIDGKMPSRLLKYLFAPLEDLAKGTLPINLAEKIDCRPFYAAGRLMPRSEKQYFSSLLVRDGQKFFEPLVRTRVRDAS